MKRINNLILALAGLFAVACADTFEERYDLAVNTDRYSVTAEAGKLPVTVYCSGAWTAQLTAESAWATLDRTAGSGITTIRLNYADNPGLTRSVGVVLRGSGLEKTVTVVQKAGITAPELIFLSKDLAFANGAYKGTAAFETNLPDELLRDVVPAVTYAAEGDAWISDVVYHADDAEAGETEIPLARRGLITFATAANATGEPRTATVGFSVTDADGNVFGDSFTVTQSADEARITLADDVAPIEGGRRAVAFSTNLGALLAEMKVEVTYADPTVADFISDVELGAGELTYAITANEGVEKRYATITVSCADLAGGVVSASSNITQRVTAQPREVSSADLRALFTAEDKSYASDEDHIDYLLCRVIGDAGNPNMDQNLNTGPNSITTDENDCTNYVQSLDGRYGFRLRFDTPEDNVLARGTRLSLSLSGTVLTREENPERYTISSLVGENMVESAAGEAIPVKQRRISELTDDDVYTFVSLENTEFLFKEGSYANVYENYSLSSDVNASQTGNNNRMDGWASLLMDDAGNSIYAPVNMLCLWRRSGQGVPQGTGTTHGIVVHNELPRYGNVGRYQIRVLDESGFGMEWAGESAYTEFAEWDGNPHKYSFGTYAKFNSRYAYNRLESITPSDDISSGKTVPNAELFCENHVETTAAEAWPIAGTGNYNNPEVGSLGTSLTCKAYFVKAGVKGWYRWEGNEVVGYNGLTHIAADENGRKDFSPLIQQALALGGYDHDHSMSGINGGHMLTTGFGHAAVLSNAEAVIAAIKSGAVKHIFLVGGCDGAHPGRNYYTEFVKKTPMDSLVLTLACGKYRFNDLDLGEIGGLPRILDMGQCNDAYSAVTVALALADAFGCTVNDLPLTLVVSWYEQKAVCILLSLLALGVKNMYLGPTLPAFLSESVVNILVDTYGLQPITAPEQDLDAILHRG